MPELRFKKLSKDAKSPIKMSECAAGWDLSADTIETGFDIVTINTNIAVEIPQNHVGLLFPRSSVYKTGLTLANSVGVIDSDYRGPIMFKYRRISNEVLGYTRGDRCGQLVIVPIPDLTLVEVDTLSETDRSSGGFGSTGQA